MRTKQPPAFGHTSRPNCTILCVADEPHVLRCVSRTLQDEEYRLLTASSGAEALEVLATTPVQVVVSACATTDLQIDDLLHEVWRDYPQTVRMLLVDCADTKADSMSKSEHVDRYVVRPWIDEELKAEIRRSLQDYEQICKSTATINNRIVRADI